MMKNRMKNRLNEKGAALITMLLLLLVLTVIGLTSVSITSLENLTAANERSYEERMNNEEAGVGPQVNVIERTIFEGALPPTYLMPSGPVPVLAAPTLDDEILTELTELDNPTLVGALGPDLQITLPDSAIVGTDIDFLFIRSKAGNSGEANSAYSGSGNSTAGGGTEKVFQMVSQSTSKNATGAITNSYICVISVSCQK